MRRATCQQVSSRSAFTLIELMVVIAIVVVLMAVSVPLLKTLAKSNGASSSVTLVRTYLGNARAIAIGQHRQVGVVFFEETSYAGPERHSNQTAMQLIIEAATQTSTTNTIFTNYDTERQYLPAGVGVATLSDSTSASEFTAQNGTTASARARVILFDANGQLVLRNGIARPAGNSTPGTYPEMYADWNLIQVYGTASSSVSSPGVLIYDKNDYQTQTAGYSDSNRTTWFQNNSQILIVNAYTGGIIRDWGGVNK